MKRQHVDTKKYDTDATMIKTWLHLASDFHTTLGCEPFLREMKMLRAGDVKGFRQYQYPGRSVMPVYFQKTAYQLENLFKRYRFKDDQYTEPELLEMSIKKFIDTQVRISVPMKVDTISFIVLNKARKICKSILGQYDPDHHASLCRFGKRATVGVPMHNSYLDVRLRAPISSSKCHATWFIKHCKTDSLLTEAIVKINKKDVISCIGLCDTLVLTYVPKSWKALRGIMPNTTIGSFYTSGLGRYIQERLLSAGLDIRHLQEKHKMLAKQGSEDRRTVTADLTAASDSLTRELLYRVLPLPWFRACDFGRIKRIRLPDGNIVNMETMLTMGLGHTFPLQTLVFYALLKAIADLAKVRKPRLSVYGDDLIYARSLHNFVPSVFSRLHLDLNYDKTYANDFFRESCGGDYCHGFDVRPHQPEGYNQRLDRRSYAYFLYKLYNGLVARWDEVEISQTLEYIKTELILSIGEIYRVPPSFPSGSGIKVEVPDRDLYLFTPIDSSRSKTSKVFQYLAMKSDDRVVNCQIPYYWEKMRSSSLCEELNEKWDNPSDTPILSWRKLSYKGKASTSGGRKRPVIKIIPVVSSKTKHRLCSQKGQVPTWSWGLRSAKQFSRNAVGARLEALVWRVAVEQYVSSIRVRI